MRRATIGSFPNRRGHAHPDAPDLAVRPLVGALLLAGGLGSLLAAWTLAAPRSGRDTALGATTLLVTAALVAVVVGVALLVRGTECRTRRLFRARRLFVIGVALAAVAPGLAIGCLMTGPFQSVLATGRRLAPPTPQTLACSLQPWRA